MMSTETESNNIEKIITLKQISAFVIAGTSTSVCITTVCRSMALRAGYNSGRPYCFSFSQESIVLSRQFAKSHIYIRSLIIENDLSGQKNQFSNFVVNTLGWSHFYQNVLPNYCAVLQHDNAPLHRSRFEKVWLEKI